ncbi:MAG: hypothetical protein ACJZ5P_04890 [Candidatus Thalassarchaeaceae archaeon]
MTQIPLLVGLSIISIITMTEMGKAYGTMVVMSTDILPSNYGTYCYYSTNQLNYLTVPIDLSGVSGIQFDLHWDLEGYAYGTTHASKFPMEIMRMGGYIINRNLLGTRTQCRS